MGVGTVHCYCIQNCMLGWPNPKIFYSFVILNNILENTTFSEFIFLSISIKYTAHALFMHTNDSMLTNENNIVTYEIKYFVLQIKQIIGKIFR